MASVPDDIFNQVINQYTGSITNIQTGSIALGQELFNSVALISVGLLGLNHLLRKNVDMVDANFELIRWLIYLDFFYAFITNYPNIYSFVFSSIQQIGSYLGSKAAANPVEITPANIIHIGFGISMKMLATNIKFNLFRNFLIVIVSVLAGVAVMYCFAVICLEVILVQIGSQIILAGGIFLLAFSGLQWTRDYAERYVHTFFHVGIKMVFIYILVGIGIGLTQNWAQVINGANAGQLIEYDIAVCIATFIYYKLCLKVPDQAVSWLTGRFPMGFDAAASVNAAVRGTHSLVHKGKEWADKKVAGIQGNIMAENAADQAAKMKFEVQGKTPSAMEFQMESLRTLGEAQRTQWVKDMQEKTEGGKLAKIILDEIPKPEKTAKKGAKKGTNEDYAI